MKKILFIAGTRPEAIKLAPLLLEMRTRPGFSPIFCATGQHPDLMNGALEAFDLQPDFTLETMQPGQTVTDMMAAVLRETGMIMSETAPDAVIVQGDTLSACAGTWAAFLQKIPVIHVEAGLRTYDLANPFPEEANRRAISLLATWHAAPTAAARENLLCEGIDERRVSVTGNTAIDALFHVKSRLHSAEQAATDFAEKRILVTCHRRENLGSGVENVCAAIRTLAAEFPQVQINWVLHPNPAAAEPARRLLSAVPNIRLIPPLNYPDFVGEMLQSYFLISDSGGIQEEAPALGKPVLVTRLHTERPEAIAAGANKLVGTDPQQIIAAAKTLLTDADAYAQMAQVSSPYGDGTASRQICDWLTERL